MKKLIVENFTSKKGNETIGLAVVSKSGLKKYISFDIPTIVAASGLSPREIYMIEPNSYVTVTEY